MKKIYSFLAAILLSSVMFGQQFTSVANDVVRAPKKTFKFDSKTFAKNKHSLSKTSAINSAWFCTGEAIDTNILSGIGVVTTYPFFPDTNGKFTFSNGLFSTFVHALGEVVDPKNIGFTAVASTDFIVNPTSQPYSVDSVSIVYGYDRLHANPNTVDTLIVMIANNNTASNLLGGYYPASTATFVTSYGTDTLQLHRPKYTYTTQTLNAVGSIKIKVPLTLLDTATTFLREKKIALPTPFSVPAGKVLIASVVYKPGFSYVEGDVIDVMGNPFYFASYEEGGTNTYPIYTDCGLSSPICDFSNSLIANSSIRYNTNTTGFNGSFLPSYAFGQGYRWEHHVISFKLSAGTVGVNELAITSNGVAALSQNIPNPFTKESTVNYNLAKEVASAVFTVTDVMGRVVSSEKVGTSVGNHSIKLGAYAAGLYYYSLNVDGNVTTKKMIVE
jgi:hypothetical protein